jgi:hypothetical protein
VALRSKAWACGHSLVRILPSVRLSVFCDCCVLRVEVSAMGRSLVQRGSTECGVSEYDDGASTTRMPCATRGLSISDKNLLLPYIFQRVTYVSLVLIS